MDIHFYAEIFLLLKGYFNSLAIQFFFFNLKHRVIIKKKKKEKKKKERKKRGKHPKEETFKIFCWIIKKRKKLKNEIESKNNFLLDKGSDIV